MVKIVKEIKKYSKLLHVVISIGNLRGEDRSWMLNALKK